MAESYLYRPSELATFRSDKMGKATLFRSENLLVGLNCFLPGQEHELHSHSGMDKAYVVLEGRGNVTVGDQDYQVGPGDVIIAPSGVKHGVRNTGTENLVLLAILAPAPSA